MDPSDPNYGPYSANKYPWLVAISSSVLCIDKHWTGTLVSDRFIVSSASMFKNKVDCIEQPHFFSARPASPNFDIDINITPENCPNCKPPISKWVDIEQIWIHPYYKRKIDNVHQLELPSDDLSYNVALFKLETRVDLYTEYSYKAGIRPICLPKPGQTTIQDIKGKSNNKGLLFGRGLKMVEAEIIGDAQCSNAQECAKCLRKVRPKLQEYSANSKLYRYVEIWQNRDI